MSRRITKAEYRALAAFRYALRQFMRFGEDAAVMVGITPQQHQALLAIKGFPERDSVSIGELAERLQVRHHSAVGLVDRLATQGLVVREQDAVDRRHVYVALTERGAQLLEELASAHRGELRRVGPELLTQLKALLRGVEKRSVGAGAGERSTTPHRRAAEYSRRRAS